MYFSIALSGSRDVRGHLPTSTFVEVKRYHQGIFTPDSAQAELAIGQIAERSGIPVSALHFYEREGLIASDRSVGNQRRFARDVLRRLAFIRASQRVGIPLAAIKEALDDLPSQRTPREADWAVVGARWRAVLDGQIEYLTRVREDLSTCIGCGCLSLQRCQLVNPSDAMAEEGAGPRRLLPGTPRPDRS